MGICGNKSPVNGVPMLPEVQEVTKKEGGRKERVSAD